MMGSNRLSLYLTDKQQKAIEKAAKTYKMSVPSLIFYVLRKIGRKKLITLIRINKSALSCYHGSYNGSSSSSRIYWVPVKERRLFELLKKIAKKEGVSVSGVSKLLLHQAVLVVRSDNEKN